MTDEHDQGTEGAGHRRRRRLGTVAAVALVVLAGITWVALGRGNSTSVIAGPVTSDGSAATTAPSDCADPMTTVYLMPGATAAQIHEVRKNLANVLPEHLDFVDEKRTYAQFQQLFADQPQFVAGIDPAELPQSFRVSWPLPAEQVATLEALSPVLRVEFAEDLGPSCADGGVDEATSSTLLDEPALVPGPPCDDAMTFVYLQPGVTPESVDGVRSRLIGLGVEQYEYLDEAATYAEFLELFAEQPDLLPSIRPEDLPPSFRVTGELDEAGRSSVATLPDVLRVEGSADACSGPPPGSGVDGTTTSILGG